MAAVRWTEQAVDDLEAIVNYIALGSDHYARLLVTDVFAAIERAALFPNAGRIVPEADNSDIREILLGNYRIIYRIKYDAIVIVALYHSARLLDPSRLN